MASPLDPSLYAWSAHPGKPNLYLRRALGVENKWVREALARQNQVLLYLYGELSFKNPIQISKFVERARCAWMRLRWLHPEVCLGPYLPNAHGSVSGMDDEESRKMCCPVPSSHEEVMAWAKATLSFDFERNNAFLGLRERVAELRKDRVPPVVLRFAASGEQVVGENKMLIKVQYAFCVDHSCTDGIGMYLIAGIYLALLAEQLSDSAPKNLDWASCVDNLPVPWVRILNREQRTGGVELEKSVIALRGQIDEYLVCARKESKFRLSTAHTDDLRLRKSNGDLDFMKPAKAMNPPGFIFRSLKIQRLHYCESARESWAYQSLILGKLPLLLQP